jgi:hypothetical protein
MVLQKMLPGYEMEACESSLLYRISDGYAVEGFDYEAKPALSGHLEKVWYPQFTATVVIAVDRARTDAQIDGWQSLLSANEPVGSRMDATILAAIAYSMEGDNFSLQSGAKYFRQLYEEDRLLEDSTDAPLLILFDYQAAALCSAGRELEIILPSEGTLCFDKGILSDETLRFPAKMKQALVQAGYRLCDGACDDTLYPSAAEYVRAGRITNYNSFNSMSSEMGRIVRREVTGEFRFPSYDGKEHAAAAIFTIGLMIAWSALILMRCTQKQMRTAAFMNGCLLVTWVAIRGLKYITFSMPLLNRYMWYTFYIFMLAIPMLFLWMALSIGQLPTEHKIPVWWYVLAAYNILVLFLVMTNDAHQLVFRFAGNDLQSKTYTYGPGCYFVIFGIMIPVLSSAAVLMTKCAKSRRIKAILLPGCAITGMTLYCIGYILRIPFCTGCDITIVSSLLIMAFWELSLHTGLIPVNTMYRSLFLHSPLRMRLIDCYGESVLCAAQAGKLPEAVRQKVLCAAPSPVPLGRKTLFYFDVISGGWIILQEDVQPISRLNEALQEAIRQTASVNALLRQRQQIGRSLQTAKARSELMQKLQKEIGLQITQMNELLCMIPKDNIRKKDAARAALLGCCIKRHSALFLWQFETQKLGVEELCVYLDEMTQYAGAAGLKCLCLNSLQGDVPILCAKLFYDFFYTGIDWALKNQCGTMIASLTGVNSGMAMKLMFSGEPTAFEIPQTLYAEVDANGGGFTLGHMDDATDAWLTFPVKGGTENA